MSYRDMSRAELVQLLAYLAPLFDDASVYVEEQVKAELKARAAQL